MISIVNEILNKHDYNMISYISKGSFGSCYLVYSEKYKMQFVCKVSSWHTFDGINKQSFDREVKALTSLNHPNIVRVYDVFTGLNYLFLILEFCSGGSLLDLINSGKRIPEADVIKYSRQICDALSFMHEKGFAHCDLKLSNVLIDDFGRAKLCDFGLTQFINQKTVEVSEENDDECSPESSSKSSQVAGTLNFMAPEVMMQQPYDPFKADVWSFGVTLYCLATGRLPFRTTSYEVLVSDYKRGLDTRRISNNDLKEIITMCLEFSPEVRPTMKLVMKKVSQRFHEAASMKPKAFSVLGNVARAQLINGNRRLRNAPKTILL